MLYSVTTYFALCFDPPLRGYERCYLPLAHTALLLVFNCRLDHFTTPPPLQNLNELTEGKVFLVNI